MIEPLALIPADGIVRVLAGDDFGRAEAAADRLDRIAQIGSRSRWLTQLDDSRAISARGVEIENVGRLVHRLVLLLVRSGLGRSNADARSQSL
jgi:Mor family transcriptional regulator